MKMKDIKMTIATSPAATEFDQFLTVGGISVQARPVNVQVHPNYYFGAEVTIKQDGQTVRLPLYQWRELVPYVERGIQNVPMRDKGTDDFLSELRAVLADDTTTTGSK